ncbi:MAG TPA: hypothetical protein VIR79_04385 [Nitrospira sp.]
MGLMDQIENAVGGMMGGQSGNDPLLQAPASLLGPNSNKGGLARLVQTFRDKALVDIVNS